MGLGWVGELVRAEWDPSLQCEGDGGGGLAVGMKDLRGQSSGREDGVLVCVPSSRLHSRVAAAPPDLQRFLGAGVS